MGISVEIQMDRQYENLTCTYACDIIALNKIVKIFVQILNITPPLGYMGINRIKTHLRTYHHASDLPATLNNIHTSQTVETTTYIPCCSKQMITTVISGYNICNSDKPY